MKIYSSDALWSKHTFESPYIPPILGVLHPTLGMNSKEKKLTTNDDPYAKNDQSPLSFLLII